MADSLSVQQENMHQKSEEKATPVKIYSLCDTTLHIYISSHLA